MKRDGRGVQHSLDVLTGSISSLGAVIVAFSGGVDSCLLLNVSARALPDNVSAVTIKSPLVHDFEIERAKSEAKRLGIPHAIVEVDPLVIPAVRNNAPDRCYWCKREIFRMIFSLRDESSKGPEKACIIDGTNADDTHDFRPGMRALSELGVVSPFLACGIGKADIREMSRILGVEDGSRPPMACLATRFPTFEKITPEKVERVKRAEIALMDMGLSLVRVRSVEDEARIEVGILELPRFSDGSFKETVIDLVKKSGFREVSLAPDGYRTGSMNTTRA